MLIENTFDFGKIIVDAGRGLIFVDRDGSKEEFQGKCGQNEKDFKKLMDWIHGHSKLDYYDKSLLAWKYHICCNCLDLDQSQAASKEALDYLKVQSPDKVEEVRLEVVGKGRTYILRRVPDVGLVLVNPEKLVYLLGKELYWADPQNDWKQVKAFDDMDIQFVTEVIGTDPNRFFK